MGGRDAQPKAAAMQPLVRTLIAGFIFDMTSSTDLLVVGTVRNIGDTLRAKSNCVAADRANRDNGSYHAILRPVTNDCRRVPQLKRWLANGSNLARSAKCIKESPNLVPGTSMHSISAIFGAAILAITATVALSLLINYFVTGVVPMSSSRAEAAEVIALLTEGGVSGKAVVYELGCGWGMLVSALARAFPEAQIHGIEISPFPYWIARLRTRHLSNVRLHRRNFFDCDLRDADAVACYLMIKPMPKLAAFLDTMLPLRTPVVSLAFGFRDRQAAAVRKVSGLPGVATLYLWPARCPEPASAQR
jgi:hypothetical protein